MNIRSLVLAGLAVGFLGGAALAATTITAAVNDAARPAEDKALDADRKPDTMLSFAGVKPGMRVMDLMPGGGYFTRLFSAAVGAKGYVYAYEPAEFDGFSKGKPAPIIAVAAGYKNVGVLHGPIAKIMAPEKLDIVWTSQNYHDMHDSFMGPADLAVVNKAIYDALKPGGVFIVLDHAAAAGSGLKDTETLHRIDEASVKSEVEAAGFKLVGESGVLHNPNDPHTENVFKPGIRHKTDQFLLKFRKPLK